MREKKIIKAEQEEFHKAEINYQKCLDKIANLTDWETKERIPICSLTDQAEGSCPKYPKIYYLKGVNKYFDEWIEANRPNYNQDKGHWEWAFMGWMMGKYPEFCSGHNTDSINYFLDKKKRAEEGRD